MLIFGLLPVLTTFSITSGVTSALPERTRTSTAPRWKRSPLHLTYEIAEEQPVGTVVAELGVHSKLPERAHFRFMKSRLSLPVALDEATGTLRVIGRIDRDALCGRKPTCRHSLDVYAILPDARMVPVRVDVNVLDVNDNAPSFETRTFELNGMLESAPVGSRFYLPTATDPDLGRNGVQTYRLSPESAQFRVELSALRVTGQRVLELVLQRPLDRERQDTIWLRLESTDGGEPARSADIRLQINVVDANDHAPRFQRESYEVEVPENVPTMTSLVRLHADDPDHGAYGTVTYSLSSPSALFEVDNVTGTLSVVGSLDYELRNIYELVVQARDQGPLSLPVGVPVTVRLRDANDHAPEIRIDTLGDSEDAARYRVKLLAGTPVGSFVARVQVSDADSGANGRCECSIDTNDFELRARETDVYELVTSSRFEVGRYEILIDCRDLALNALHTLASVDVIVSEDVPPKFGYDTYAGVIRAGAAVGTTVLYATATSRSRVRYSILDTTATFQDERLETSVPFTIGVYNALVTNQHVITDVGDFRFKLRVEDSTGSSSTTVVRVRVLPRVTADEIDSEQAEPDLFRATLRLRANRKAKSLDSVGELSVAFVRNATPFVPDLVYFTAQSRNDWLEVDRRSGKVSVRATKYDEDDDFRPLLRAPASFQFSVDVVSRSTLSLNAVVALEFRVVPPNRRAPRFSTPSVCGSTIRVWSGETKGTSVATLRAEDDDVGSILRFEIHADVSRFPDQLFGVDSASGDIQTLRSLRVIEHGDTFRFFATVTDDGLPPLSHTCPFRVTVAAERAQAMEATNIRLVVLAVGLAAIAILSILVCVALFRKRRCRRKDGPTLRQLPVDAASKESCAHQAAICRSPRRPTRAYHPRPWLLEQRHAELVEMRATTVAAEEADSAYSGDSDATPPDPTPGIREFLRSLEKAPLESYATDQLLTSFEPQSPPPQSPPPQSPPPQSPSPPPPPLREAAPSQPDVINLRDVSDATSPSGGEKCARIRPQRPDERLLHFRSNDSTYECDPFLRLTSGEPKMLSFR